MSEAQPVEPDLHAIFEGPQYTKWNAFRESEDARYVGLLMPRFLLRLPHGSKTTPAKTFGYEEDVVGRHERYLWGNAVYAFGAVVVEAFAECGWMASIHGLQRTAKMTPSDLLHHREPDRRQAEPRRGRPDGIRCA